MVSFNTNVTYMTEMFQWNKSAAQVVARKKDVCITVPSDRDK